MLLLACFSSSPTAALKRLLGHDDPCPFIDEPRLINVSGFSAGSFTGFVVYRVLIERGSILNLRFNEGVLRGLTFHPIMFYDFLLRQDLPLCNLQAHLAFQQLPSCQGSCCCKSPLIVPLHGALLLKKRKE